MPANLSIKNVPDEVMSGLRNRAANNQRSFQAELLEILKQAASASGRSSTTLPPTCGPPRKRSA
jgi:plasmid stability protein